MTTSVTDHFGFIAVYNAVPSTSDWACTYWNWLAADSILYAAAVSHKHDGATALQNPTGTLSLSTATTGGYLAADTTYYIAITYVDAYGRETAASTVANVTTGAGITTPAAPTNNDLATPTDIQSCPGGLTGGDYWYKISYVKDGGESLPSLPLYVSIPTDTTYECTLHFTSLNDAANGADAIYVYRKTGSTGSYVKLVEITAGATSSYTDNNTGVPTCDKGPLTVSTISSFHTITVDWSSLDFSSAEKVRVYATTTDGTYPTNSLVSEVTMNDATPVTSYLWTGTARTVGKPPEVSNCYASPSKIDLASEISGNISWSNLPTDLLWKPAVATASALPTGEAGEARVVLDEDTIYIWDADTDTPHWDKISGTKVFTDVSPSGVSIGEIYTWNVYGTYSLFIKQSEYTYSLVLDSDNYYSIVGYYGYYDTIVDLQNLTPDFGYGSTAFCWEDKSFYYYDDTIDTPAWIKNAGVVKQNITIDDVVEDATPTNEQLKINEILEVLRASGLINS